MGDQPKSVPLSSYNLDYHPAHARTLCGKEGDLLLVRIKVEPKLLEELLDCLANLEFPVNPQIYHSKPTIVEFPAYGPWIDTMHKSLEQKGFPRSQVSVANMLDAIAVS